MQHVPLVSVAVLTYNPDLSKLFYTLDSILLQEGIDIEIVLSDDGSRENFQDTVEQYFHSHQFSNYRIVMNPVNRGTVWNAHSALVHATGTYVKFISPGDLLAERTTLQHWVSELIASGCSLSFSDAVYYNLQSDIPVPVQHRAAPQYVDCYLNCNYEAARYNYLVFDDFFLGAATLCTRELLLSYIEKICGKVIYAEDNIYRMMQFDKIPVYYHPYCAVLYEHGCGVSTAANNIWRTRLIADLNSTSALIREKFTGNDPLEKALLIHWTQTTSFLQKLKKFLCLRGYAANYLHKRYAPRLTATEFPKNCLINTIIRRV